MYTAYICSGQPYKLVIFAISVRVPFRQLLAAGDKDVIYPILKWVVPQPQLLEKRAYVGHYLSFPDVSGYWKYMS